MKKYVKNNYKFILGIVLGIIIFSGLGVFAATIINSTDIKYDNNNSKLISTNVQGAIDEMYNKIKNNTFETNTSKTVYATSKGVCIERNNKLNCFKNNNWDVEKDHIQQVFSDINCKVYSSYIDCGASDFFGSVYSDGYMYFRDNLANSYCEVRSNDDYFYCT